MRSNGHGVVKAVAEALGISFDDAARALLVHVDPERWDRVGELALETLAARGIRDMVYDMSPETIEAAGLFEEAEAPPRTWLAIGDTVRVGSMESVGVLLDTRRDKFVVALPNGRKLFLTKEQRHLISLADEEELFVQLDKPGIRRANRAARERAMAAGTGNTQAAAAREDTRPQSETVDDLYGVARLTYPHGYAPQVHGTLDPSEWWHDIYVMATGAFAGMKAEAWQAVQHRTPVGQGVACIRGNGGYVSYPFTVLCMATGNAPRSIWVAPEAYRDKDGKMMPVATLVANGMDITADVHTAIGLLWQRAFKCSVPLYRSRSDKRACAICAMHVAGEVDGAFDPFNPMGGPRHWCAADPAFVPLDADAVRAGNIMLRTHGENVGEHDWVPYGNRRIQPSSLRVEATWQHRCDKHLFSHEGASPRVRLDEEAARPRCIISVPGNPFKTDGNDDAASSTPKALTAIMVPRKRDQ